MLKGRMASMYEKIRARAVIKAIPAIRLFRDRVIFTFAFFDFYDYLVGQADYAFSGFAYFSLIYAVVTGACGFFHIDIAVIN